MLEGSFGLEFYLKKPKITQKDHCVFICELLLMALLKYYPKLEVGKRTGGILTRQDLLEQRRMLKNFICF